MALLALVDDQRIHAQPVLGYAHIELIGVSECQLKLTRLGVFTCIPDRFVPYAINLIPDDRMHFPRVANH